MTITLQPGTSPNWFLFSRETSVLSVPSDSLLIRFTSEFMAMATPADFVQVYDTSNGNDQEQEIDFFSEISGVYFSTDSLYSLGLGLNIWKSLFWSLWVWD
ncbi:hypothetical protein MRB53_022862 [Persea americana]|uniref:Uncharacterized protein n=1 Tax=Persea americana TaxID=3435 RepID=A0ACC2L7W6_PERAE|nr:hypothetical protein MRB53_022862 [Persea americana]